MRTTELIHNIKKMNDIINVGVRFIEPAGKLPKRKEIRLKSYNYKSDGYYFVTVCTHRGEPNIRRYRDVVERILLSLPERFSGSKTDWYVLMSTHLHVIIVFDGIKDGLPEVVKTFTKIHLRLLRIIENGRF